MCIRCFYYSSGVIFSNGFVPIFFEKIGNALPENPAYMVSDKTLWTEKLKSIDRKDYLNIASFLYEALADVEKNKKVSMVDAALASGFSSLASFNRNFREIEGVSPSEYRKNLGITK